MVGVSGKSKGCSTCRKRKIKCDETRPTCVQCAKSKRVCGGYERERVFRNVFKTSLSDEGTSTAVIRRSQESPIPLVKGEAFTTHEFFGGDSSGSSTASWSPRHFEDAPDTSDFDFSSSVSDDNPDYKDSSWDIFSEKSGSGDLSDIWPETSASYNQLPPMPLFSTPNVVTSRRLFLQQLLLERLLPSASYTESAENAPAIIGDWFLRMPLLANASSALSNGTTALGSLLVWQTTKEGFLLKESLNSYGRALLALRKILASDRDRLKDETLAATLLLAAYESSLSSKAIGGWISHTTGACHLVKLRGPNAHRHGLAHELFLNCRHMGLMEALASRRATFFAEHNWCTIPWSAGRRKSPYHKLIDIMLRIPGIIERSLNLRLTRLTILPQSFEYKDHQAKISRSIENFAEIESMLDDAWDTINALTAWKIDYELELKESLYTLCPATLPFSRGIFVQSFEFSSFVTAQCLTQYWAVSIMLYSTLVQSYIVLDLPAPDFEIIQSALNICSSMEYFLHPQNKVTGIKIACLPIRVALETFVITKMAKEEAWCLEMYDLIAKMGLPWVKAVGSHSWANWRKASMKDSAVNEHEL